MMVRWMMCLSVCVALSACGVPKHFSMIKAGGSYDLKELFLSGWNGRRLTAFNDVTIEPRITQHQDLSKLLSNLNADQYGTLYVEKAKLDAAFAEKHDIFCATPFCIVVLDRAGGDSISSWGNTVAVFELAGVQPTSLVGTIWMHKDQLRAPGVQKWPNYCRNKEDVPRRIHLDGGAVYPGRASVINEGGFVHYGVQEEALEYQKAKQTPYSEVLCDMPKERPAEMIEQTENKPEPIEPQIVPDKPEPKKKKTKGK